MLIKDKTASPHCQSIEKLREMRESNDQICERIPPCRLTYMVAAARCLFWCCQGEARKNEYCWVLRPVLLTSRDGEQRWFGGQRDLDYSAPRVWWLCTPLGGKAEVQGTRPSKPEKKGTRLIGNSRGIAVRVGQLLSGSGKALDTFLCPLHELGLVEDGRI